MPYYDLKCSKCNYEFNKKAAMADRSENKIKCPECGSNELEAVFKNINIIQSRKNSPPACPNMDKCGSCCEIR